MFFKISIRLYCIYHQNNQQNTSMAFTINWNRSLSNLYVINSFNLIGLLWDERTNVNILEIRSYDLTLKASVPDIISHLTFYEYIARITITCSFLSLDLSRKRERDKITPIDSQNGLHIWVFIIFYPNYAFKYIIARHNYIE